VSEEKPTLLIIEDDVGIQKQLKWCFENFNVEAASDRASGIKALRRYEPAIVLCDLGLPPDPANATEGLKALAEILSLQATTKVIVVTGNDDRDVAIQAIRMGAYDFYQKPIDAEVLKMIVARAWHLWQLEQESRLQSDHQISNPLQGIIAASPQMLTVCRTVEKLAPTNATVLLLGQSGTGKELVARALHRLSLRDKQPFIAINCAAIPDNLLESELFGHEKGAFTGAIKRTIGKIEQANGGTLFLDEIGDLPLPLQAKLLRFLQERVIERVGGRQQIPVDVRIISATHQDLPEKITSAEFREDLYYRVSEVSVLIPPLKDREGDVLLLAKTFLERCKKEMNRSELKGFSSVAVQAIMDYEWPGNVRELENKVKRAVIMAEQNEISAQELEIAPAHTDHSLPLNLRAVRERAETSAIIQAVNHAEGNMSRAAELLGITRPTLYSLVGKYNLKV
jgi:two-component system, NtrC family, response regulator